MNRSWFPAKKIPKKLDFVFDSVQSDFDQQAALYSGIDLTYTQLTEGKFRGRLFSANLGSVTVYVEYCNQAIEKEVGLSPNDYSFSVVLEDDAPSMTYGVMQSKELVYVLPPSGEAVTVSPPNGIIMVVTIDRNALIDNGLLLSDAAEWLEALDKRGEFLQSTRLADRIRTETFLALESIAKAKTPEMRAQVANLIIHAIATAFTLEWLKPKVPKTFQRTSAYERYRYLRSLLRGGHRVVNPVDNSPSELSGSKRSIELAFSALVSMGPLTYSRVARLHNARRKLLDKGRLKKSIGDIAAEEGFWDWSKFSTYYRRQFGELPSDTRERLVA